MNGWPIPVYAMGGVSSAYLSSESDIGRDRGVNGWGVVLFLFAIVEFALGIM